MVNMAILAAAPSIGEGCHQKQHLDVPAAPMPRRDDLAMQSCAPARLCFGTG